MTEPVSNNNTPAPPPVEPFKVDEKKDSTEIQSLKIKTNETLQNSKIEVSGNQQRPWVDVTKGMQVPQ